MKKYSGFTLIELLMVLSIIGILLAFGVPSFNELIKNDRLTTQINTLVGHLAYARSEAVLRAQQVGVCASSTGTSCTGTWSEGWILYVNADNSGVYDAAADTILRVNQALSGDSKLTGTDNNFLYDNRGYAESDAQTSFSLCDDRGVAHAKMIVISKIGRVRQNTGTESPSC